MKLLGQPHKRYRKDGGAGWYWELPGGIEAQLSRNPIQWLWSWGAKRVSYCGERPRRRGMMRRALRDLEASIRKYGRARR